MTKLAALARRLLEHRGLPFALALVAVVFMLPALTAGLFGDDLIQRLVEFPPAELPPRVLDIGFVPKDSGQLGAVLNNMFGYVRGKAATGQARDYGIEPWWASEDWHAALWRPCTALTHWLDYRLYPNSPGLMHAQNIVWYAAAVFLTATLYRKIAVRAGSSGLCAAGLAACLWLLDKDTYGPVAYVANRGFFIALVFGLLCLRAHIRWRTGQSKAWMGLSALCLLLSLLADEGGASSLAFLLAYALVLEPGGWRPRLGSLLPAAGVILVWRAVYVGCGFGVRNFPGYVDPGYSPFLFLKDLVPRANALLGGQLMGVPPELMLALNAAWQTILALVFAGFSLACLLAFLPAGRQDAAARFWAVVMLLALVPAATVAPLSKNLGFIAVGAFGVMASFLVRFATTRRRALSWCVAGWIALAHVFGAMGARIGLALVTPYLPGAAEQAVAWKHSPDVGQRDVVVINDPTLTYAVVPFDRAYRGRPLPKTLRALAPGSMAFEVSRPDASTLILKAKESDLFACPIAGPVDISYVAKAANDFLFGEKVWQAGDQVTNKTLVAKILEAGPRGTPRAVAFQFKKSLESDGMLWLFFDWRRLAHMPFALPRIGETVEIAGSNG